MLIRRGKRVADILGSNCFAVYVAEKYDLQGAESANRRAVDRHLNFARNLHIETRVLIGKDQAQTIVDFARSHGARQIFMSRITAKGMERLRYKSLVNQVVSLAKDMEVTIVADRRKTGNRPARVVG